jgi:hypothetical protein
MSEILGPTGLRSRARSSVLGLVMLASSLAGCASVSQDVDAYYRQMAYNYKEAEEKARMEAITVENETKVLATTGDYRKVKASQRSLNRIKNWEEKCEKESRRFEKAAEWMEARFHLEKPPIPDKPPGYHAAEDPAVMQASGVKDP